MQPIPAAHDAHIQQLRNAPWLQAMFNGPWQNATFQLVQIDSLLAFQITVDTDRATHHCGGLTNPPTLAQLLPICLPTVDAPENIVISELPPAQPGIPANSKSIILKSRSLNFRVVNQGQVAPNVLGIQLGMALPHVQVLRFNNRSYLHNGFHRATGARALGATEIPCLVRDVASADEVGIRTDGTTFPLALLESANPPTLGHFIPGRAHNVMLRAMMRIVQLSWADHILPVD